MLMNFAESAPSLLCKIFLSDSGVNLNTMYPWFLVEFVMSIYIKILFPICVCVCFFLKKKKILNTPFYPQNYTSSRFPLKIIWSWLNKIKEIK